MTIATQRNGSPLRDLLSIGSENAKSSKVLCELLHIGKRDLTKLIASERFSGFPICAAVAGRPGYFIPRDDLELELYCDCLKHRAIELFRVRKACLDQLGKLQKTRGA